ncbi:MAG: U32 family peptidase [Acidobacteriota bacterium]|nr:U32 family peptidase [Acidobacteriota bacterium]
MSKPIEILAPAGSPDSLRAALASGADAVYLGLKDFNARGNAVNFSTEELAHYVPLAHAAGTRVYLTLNTVVKMNEMGPVLEQLARAEDCGIDGVILQDIGLGRVMARYFPNLRRHASTQMAIHNLEGVQFCVDEGFERVVLARELTFREITEIRQAFPADVIQLEVFCHGAMCYTYSGMCFFSGSVGGRSGNRGECAYTCRKGYRIHNETRFPMAAEPGSYHNYLFSMKDMNTLDVLPELIDTGIDSLKIEGRRKGPAYVSASVQAYRERLARQETTDVEKDLSLAFGRAYTRAFYERGQFGDNPVDITATGSRGLHIGTLDEDGSFELLSAGIQRYDGIRLVKPDRSEELLSFRDYRCGGRDRNRPKAGAMIHLKGDYPAGTEVMWVHSQEVERRYKPEKERVTHAGGEITGRVDMTVFREGETWRLVARCPYGEVSRVLPVEPSTSGKSAPLRKILFRFGDSDFLEGRWQGPEEIPGFLPPSVLKKMRREVLAQLAEPAGGSREAKLAALIEEANRPQPTAPRMDEPPRFILRLDQPDLLSDILPYAQENRFGIDFVTRPTLSTPDWRRVTEQLADFIGPLRLALPMVLRHWDLRLLRRRLAERKGEPVHVVIANPGHLPLVRRHPGNNAILHADFSIYHLNTWAWRALKDMGVTGRFTLSLEDDRPNMEALLASVDPAAFEVIAYTDTPLFVAEACSLAALYGGCPGARVCKHETLHISNEHGDTFQVRHDRCRSTVVGDQALSWSGRLNWFRRRGVHHFRADFTTRPYTVEEVRRIMDHLVDDKPITKTHTENLDRILL